MTPRDFCYWLQGFFELNNVNNLTTQQVKMIEDHLQLVFNKETPNYPILSSNNPKGLKEVEWENLPPDLGRSPFFCNSEHPISC